MIDFQSQISQHNANPSLTNHLETSQHLISITKTSSDMFSIVSAFTALAIVSRAIAYINTGVHCGTTADATLSDCEALVNDQSIWDAAFNTGNICHYSNVIENGGIPAEAYNVACHGNCCVYVAGYAANQIDKYFTQEQAQGLLGCGDTANNKINALQTFDDHGVCISSGDGCGDCFDDSDFTKRWIPKRRAVEFGRDKF
ncbi:hypothetical protein BD324DRAFT_630088 [Kockovaella imperatae]|uniref:Uncharacterized protein n=1 Tax=Kockovaella imperatae TaxID=4999 RepID=A0A1Y1UDJ7_9TREE|nr:hypothetical protein BD324DRAFT_630088 [Kockovaella imperatae]ORX36082.1 hypothetical protein BD324DRAFT_630088 [Kockovaella imperatae]